MFDVSKVNEAILMVKNECAKHKHCSSNPVCPCYDQDIDCCVFSGCGYPDGWCLIKEGDADVGSEKQN